MTWASRPLASGASVVVAAVRTGFTLDSIETPRGAIETRPRRRWRDILRDDSLKTFDHVPVTDDGKIVGVFDRASGQVCALRESVLRAADSSLLSHVEEADKCPFVLLVRDAEISGMVTLSDIQKLPVYCVTFSLLMSVEMLLMDWIRKVCRGRPDEWLDHLDARARKRIEADWRSAQARDVALDRLSCARFTDEVRAADGLGLEAAEGITAVSLNRLRTLRNIVCHGMELAMTPSHALAFPAKVREATRIQTQLEAAVISPAN